MSHKKVTPRTMITDFLGSVAVEHSGMRRGITRGGNPGIPSGEGNPGGTRRSSRHASGPVPGATAKSSRQQSKVQAAEGKQKTMHLSMMEDNTPRMLLSDFIHDTKTTEPTRKRPQLEKSPIDPPRKSPRLNRSESAPRRSPRATPVDISPRRRRSLNTSLHKKTVMRNFANSPNHKKRKEITPRQMITNFLTGDTPAQTPLVAQHTGPTPSVTHSFHSTSSFNINNSPSEESLLVWQSQYQRPPVVGGGTTRTALTQLSQHVEAQESAEDSLHVETEAANPDLHGNRSNTSGDYGNRDVTGNHDATGNRDVTSNQDNSVNLSVMSSGDIDGSYLSLPSSQLTQKSTRGNRSKMVQEITAAAIQEGIEGVMENTPDEDSSKTAHTLEQIDEAEEVEEEGSMNGEEVGDPAGREDEHDDDTAENTEEQELNDEDDEDVREAADGGEDKENEEIVPPSDNEIESDDELPVRRQAASGAPEFIRNISATNTENSTERDFDNRDRTSTAQEFVNSPVEAIHRSGALDVLRDVDRNVSTTGGADGESFTPGEGDSPAQNVNRTDLHTPQTAGFTDGESYAPEQRDSPAQNINRTNLRTPQTSGFTSEMSTPGSASHTPSVPEGYDRLRTPVMPTGKPMLAGKGRSLTVAFPTPLHQASAPSQASTSSSSQAKKPRAPRKPRDKNAPVRMPTSNTRSIFTHFCGKKVSKDAIAEIERIADKFWDKAADDLFAFAEHAKRKFNISETDVDLLMKRQGFVTDKCSMYTLVEKYLPLEQRQEIIPCARADGKVYPPN